MTLLIDERPPLDLTATLRTADGRTEFSWGPGEQHPGSRPLGLSFQTARFDGFKTNSQTLRRPIDRDYPDLALLDELVLTGSDGSIAYEGRVHGQPRSTGGNGSIEVGTVGWLSHAKDRKFSAIIIDREITRWQPPPLQRRIGLTSLNTTLIQGSSQPDGLVFDVPNETVPANTITEMYYDAGPAARVAQLLYRGVRAGTWTAFEAPAVYAVDDLATFISTALTLDDTDRSAALTAARRYLMLRAFTTAGAAAAAGVQQRYSQLAVIGDHGLPLAGTAPEQGFLASDIIRWLIETYCPKLNAAGVKDTSRPITHLAFHDRVSPYDAMLTANRPHLWGLECWERRTVHYAGVDLTDYDWQVRTDDPGVEIQLQGDSTEDLISGLEVEFSNALTGQPDLLLPADHPELRDERVDNPFNRAGYPGEDTLRLSDPTTPELAIEIGRIALAERNQPKAPGTITVRGHIRDRAGAWQPVWKVRAGQRIAIVDYVNDRPRLIVETSYDHDPRQIRIAVDSSFKALDAILDRINTGLIAAGLTR